LADPGEAGGEGQLQSSASLRTPTSCTYFDPMASPSSEKDGEERMSERDRVDVVRHPHLLKRRQVDVFLYVLFFSFVLGKQI